MPLAATPPGPPGRPAARCSLPCSSTASALVAGQILPWRPLRPSSPCCWLLLPGARWWGWVGRRARRWCGAAAGSVHAGRQARGDMPSCLMNWVVLYERGERGWPLGASSSSSIGMGLAGSVNGTVKANHCSQKQAAAIKGSHSHSHSSRPRTTAGTQVNGVQPVPRPGPSPLATSQAGPPQPSSATTHESLEAPQQTGASAITLKATPCCSRKMGARWHHCMAQPPPRGPGNEHQMAGCGCGQST